MAQALTFHEVYGKVTTMQLRAYKHHNVSQSDHDQLVSVLGDSNHDEIVKVVNDPLYHLGDSFSVFLWLRSQ